jgi:predicted RNase H-like HicB family nuclease
LPVCYSQGETIEEALENIKEAIALYLEDNVRQKFLDKSIKAGILVQFKRRFNLFFE